MISTQLKIEICKEVLIKSGFDKDKDIVDSVAFSVMNDRFIVDLDETRVIAFVTWEKPQLVKNGMTVFINNLWIDPKYRNGKYLIRIRTILREKFGKVKAIWFNHKRNKLVERI